jgi:8-oxo-dGTP pyrophosphatase MutT (NUDIX family)
MMTRPAAIKYLRSAGGVISRKAGGEIEVALIATKNSTVWTLPKGIINRDETPEMAAIREINEETGLLGEIVDTLGEKSYWFYLKDENAKCKKTVTYFLLRYISGDTADFNIEVDNAGWFPIEKALQMLSYRSDRDIVALAMEKLKHNGKDINT